MINHKNYNNIIKKIILAVALEGGMEKQQIGPNFSSKPIIKLCN